MKNLKIALFILVFIPAICLQGCATYERTYLDLTSGTPKAWHESTTLSLVGPTTNATQIAGAYMIGKQANSQGNNGNTSIQSKQKTNGIIYLSLTNEKTYFMYEILEGPGAGLVLRPGDISEPVGFAANQVAEFTIKEVEIKTGKTRIFRTGQKILIGQTCPILPYL